MIIEKINNLVGSQPGEKVSPGHAVKAMIINGLGLVSSPLYLSITRAHINAPLLMVF
jgi:hypothetical protein